jgi:hypothetical protein
LKWAIDRRNSSVLPAPNVAVVSDVGAKLASIHKAPSSENTATILSVGSNRIAQTIFPVDRTPFASVQESVIKQRPTLLNPKPIELLRPDTSGF